MYCEVLIFMVVGVGVVVTFCQTNWSEIWASAWQVSTPCTAVSWSHPVLSLSLSYRYHLRDVVVGKIYFLLVRIKIKHMELSIIKRETSGSGANVYNENETLVKHEIMDGAPVRGL